MFQSKEGKWKFSFDDEKKPGFLLFNVELPKFMSSSLIDVDIHPTYISLVIKSKILRLVLPTEVKSNESTAQRSTTTGHLLLSMPKVNSDEIVLYSKNYKKVEKNQDTCNGKDSINNTKKNNAVYKISRLGEQNSSRLPQDAEHRKKMTPNAISTKKKVQLDLIEVSSKMKAASLLKPKSIEGESIGANVEDEPPPIF